MSKHFEVSGTEGMRISPQEKQIRDYINQRVNNYGENDKSARNALRKRKRWVNRAYRQKVNSALKDIKKSSLTETNDISAIRKHFWCKCPNQLSIDVRDRKRNGNPLERNYSSLRDEAEKRLYKSKAVRGL